MNRYIVISISRFSFEQFKIYKVCVIAVSIPDVGKRKIYRITRNAEMQEKRIWNLREAVTFAYYLLVAWHILSSKSLEQILWIIISFFPQISIIPDSFCKLKNLSWIENIFLPFFFDVLIYWNDYFIIFFPGVLLCLEENTRYEKLNLKLYRP